MSDEVTVRSATRGDGKKVLVLQRTVQVEQEIDLPFDPGTDVFDLLAELSAKGVAFRFLSPGLNVGKGSSKSYSLNVYAGGKEAEPLQAEDASTDLLFQKILVALNGFYAKPADGTPPAVV